MATEQLTFILFSLVWFLIGIGLIFVKIDADNLKSKSHAMPGLALFRFSLFRWGAVLVCIIGSTIFLLLGLRWL